MKHLKIYLILFLFPAIQVYAQSGEKDSQSIIETDSLQIRKLMYHPEIDTISTRIKNLSETESLSYKAFIEYRRSEKDPLIQDLLQMQLFGNPVFNQYIHYVDTAYLSAAYGNSEQSPLTIATKFNADSAGFNLSDVGTWFIAGQDTSGIIQVEIRAGGSSIQDAIVVSRGDVRYEVSKNDVNGHFYGIELEKPVAMYPNEDFYVLFTYPAGISQPQGCAVNNTLPDAKGRYLLKDGEQFIDLQQQKGYSNAAWLVYAAEKSPKDIAWLNFVGSSSGTIRADSSSLLSLQLNGFIADLGLQYADIVISPNDTINQAVRIPVRLWLNEAPYFLDAPSELFVREASDSTIQIKLKDYENNAFSIVPVIGCKFVQFSVKDSIMTLKITPAKGDMGDYLIKYNAIDEYGAVRELEIRIHVLENQAPTFINPPHSIEVKEGTSHEITIEATDNERDEFEISLTDAPDFVDSSFEYPVIKLFFNPKTGVAGNYNIRLTAIDTFGSIRELTIPVYVSYKNRPPICLKDTFTFQFSFLDEATNFDINEYFMDPDGDTFSFDIRSLNSNVVEVSNKGESHFTLKPRSVGSTILDFTLKDDKGEQAEYSLNVTVGSCEDPSKILVQKWNKVLLVNNKLGEYTEDGFQWYKNGQPIKNATLQYYSSEDDTGGLLDFNTEYFVRIVKLNGDTIYTCPCKPVQNQAILKAYPNPVARGQFLNIENGLTNADSGIIQVIDILGNVRKTVQADINNTTVQMPETPGFYIVRVVLGDREDVFRIKVK